MKKIIMVGAFLVTTVFTTAAFAGATTNDKTTNSQGSAVGQASSAHTGNGGVIGGKGSPGGTYGGPADQTTGPNTRSDGVQSLLGH